MIIYIVGGDMMYWLIDADTGEIFFQDEDFDIVFEIAKIVRNANNELNIWIIRG